MGFSEKIADYVTAHSGLKLVWVDSDQCQIHQMTDKKFITLNLHEIEEILVRNDYQQEEFLQINMQAQKKILITKNLIGFKPLPIQGLELSRLPKVVTTVDLVSVAQAIEELLSGENSTTLIEVDILRRVYMSILYGAEKVGFCLDEEKRWLAFNFHHFYQASA